MKVTTDAGEGWGECVAIAEQTYSAEFVDACDLVIRNHLWPTVAEAVGAATGRLLAKSVLTYNVAPPR